MDNRTIIQGQLREALEGTGICQVVYARADVAPPLYAFVVNFPSIVLVLDGRYEIELAEGDASTLRSLEAGDVLYTPTNCWYRPTWKEASHTLTILFGRRQTGFSLVSSVPGRNGPVLEVSKYHTIMELSNLCRDLLGLCDQARQPHHNREIATRLVQALLLSSEELLQDHPAAALTKPRALYESICSYVQEHFHQQLTRDMVASEFTITPTHLSRLFRTEGLMRFWDYVTLVRLDRAKFLLVQYDIPIKVIAARCGFSDTAYFCRLFRRRMKLTPMQYRLKYRRNRVSRES
jgi:AraC-like DNA-binding protein